MHTGFTVLLNNHCIMETPITGTLANSEVPDELQHNAVFNQDLLCLLRLKLPSGTEIHAYHNLQFLPVTP